MSCRPRVASLGVVAVAWFGCRTEEISTPRAVESEGTVDPERSAKAEPDEAIRDRVRARAWESGRWYVRDPAAYEFYAMTYFLELACWVVVFDRRAGASPGTALSVRVRDNGDTTVLPSL